MEIFYNKNHFPLVSGLGYFTLDSCMLMTSFNRKLHVFSSKKPFMKTLKCNSGLFAKPPLKFSASQYKNNTLDGPGLRPK